MIRIILCIYLFFISINTLFAQGLIPKQKSMEIYMTVPLKSSKEIFSMNDYSIGLGMLINTQKGNHKRFALEYIAQNYFYKEFSIPIKTYLLEGGYSFFLIGVPSRTLAVNIGINAMVGYQDVNHSETILPDGALLQSQNTFLYGGKSSVSLDVYLHNDLLLFLQANISALWSNSLRMFRPSMGIGVRYIF